MTSNLSIIILLAIVGATQGLLVVAPSTDSCQYITARLSVGSAPVPPDVASTSSVPPELKRTRQERMPLLVKKKDDILNTKEQTGLRRRQLLKTEKDEQTLPVVLHRPSVCNPLYTWY